MTETPVPKLPVRLDGLTALRFPAAMAVAIFHITPILVTLPALTDLTNTGYTGVAFFFCLSGFVLTWGADTRTERAATFYRHRFARIYPVHFVYWVAIALVVQLHHNRAVPPASAKSLFLGFALVQSWTHDLHYALALNSPAWSLSCEAAFYLSFPLVVRLLPRWLPDPRNLILAILIAEIAVSSLTRWAVYSAHGSQAAISPQQWLYVFPPYRFAEFLVGMVLARSVRSGWRPDGGVPKSFGRLFVAVAALTIANAGVQAVSTQTYLPVDFGNFLMIVPFGWLIAAVAVSARRPAVLSPQLVMLGRWSFALYMCQGIVNITLGLSLPEHQSFFVGLAEVTLVLALTLGLSAATYFLVERPLETFLRHLKVPLLHPVRSAEMNEPG